MFFTLAKKKKKLILAVCFTMPNIKRLKFGDKKNQFFCLDKYKTLKEH